MRSGSFTGLSNPAHSSDQVHQVYDSLTHQLGYHTVTADLAKPWLIVGTLGCLLAATSALALSQRLPRRDRRACSHRLPQQARHGDARRRAPGLLLPGRRRSQLPDKMIDAGADRAVGVAVPVLAVPAPWSWTQRACRSWCPQCRCGSPSWIWSTELDCFPFSWSSFWR